MKSVRSPLKYPGGKIKLLPIIVNYLRQQGIKKVGIPFMGGAALDINLAMLGYDVYSFDNLEPLVAFFRQLQTNKNNLIKAIGEQPEPEEAWTEWRAIVKGDKAVAPIQMATAYYSLNAASWYGAGLAIVKKEIRANRHNPKQHCVHLAKYDLRNMNISLMEWEHSKLALDDAFVYLDPPYYEVGMSFYNQDTTGFKHGELAAWLKSRDNWLLSYDDVPAVRELYKDYQIREVYYTSSMKNNKKEGSRKTNDLLIFANNLTPVDFYSQDEEVKENLSLL